MGKGNEEDQGARRIRVMIYILVGGLVGLLTCFVFLFLCSVGISAGILDERMMYQLVVIACVIGGFVGGMWAVGRCRTRSLLVGLAVGLVLFLFMMTGGVLIFENNSATSGGLGLLCGSLCGGALAGLVRGKPAKRKHKMK